MKALIIRYLLKKSSVKEKTRIQRLLYGYKDHSNRGAYNYQRKGLMSDIKYRKIDQRVLLILESEKDSIISILKENNAEIEIIPVIVKSSVFK